MAELSLFFWSVAICASRRREQSRNRLAVNRVRVMPEQFAKEFANISDELEKLINH